jgi:transcriptional regulator NrdR family protein
LISNTIYSGQNKKQITTYCVLHELSDTRKMTIYKIRKRNGSIVTFEKDKITAAIQAAFEAVQNSDTDKIPALVDIIISNVESKI